MATATSRFLPTRDRGPRPIDSPRRRLSNLLTYGASAAYLLALVVLGTSGTLEFALAIVLALAPVVLMVLGTERLAIGLLVLTYFVTTFGAKGQESSPILVVDVLLMMAWFLLLPRVLVGSSRFAPPLVVGFGLLVGTGVFASVLMSPEQAASLRTLATLVFIVVVIPVAMATLHPSARMITMFSWSFVAGQVVNTLYSIAAHPTTGIRHQGLTHHPNAFGEAGMLAFGILLSLLPQSKRRRLVIACMFLCALAVYLSGSRAALLAVAMLIVAYPFVERTATAGAVTVTVIAAGVVGLLYTVNRASADSALGRLLGGSRTAAHSDSVRETALRDGFKMFGQHPLGGNGLEQVALIHNFSLEVLVGCGIFGFVGLMLIFWAVGRPLLGHSPHRGLAYPLIGFLVYSSTAPSLGDRTGWLVLSLSIAVFRGYDDPPEGFGDEEEGAPTEEVPGSRSIRAMSGRVTR